MGPPGAPTGSIEAGPVEDLHIPGLNNHNSVVDSNVVADLFLFKKKLRLVIRRPGIYFFFIFLNFEVI